jgi:hypothetical protein
MQPWSAENIPVILGQVNFFMEAECDTDYIGGGS